MREQLSSRQVAAIYDIRNPVYSGERDRRFRHRDRASEERDRGVMLRDSILWPSCVSAVLPFL